MPRGDKSKYTGKQKRQAEHIEEGYEKRGLGEDEAERRAWATVNKMTRRRQEARRLRPRQESEQGAGAQGRAHRRQGRCTAPGGGALRIRAQGGRNPQAQSEERKEIALIALPPCNMRSKQASSWPSF